jgi:NodT family efflux transporter outer membrane factor (OMF) lipoprotein
MQMNVSVRFSNRRHRKRVLASIIVCSMLLVLPSCGIPSLRQADLGLAVPPSFNGITSSENSAQLSIEAYFNDPLLTCLIDQALVTSRELRILDEEVQIARNEILARQGAFLPFVGFRGGLGVDRHSQFTPLGAAEKDLEYLPGRHFPDPLPDFLLGLNFLVPVDLWRELRNARDAAGQRYNAAVERRNFFVTRLVADVAENNYGLMALDKRLETLDLTIELQEQGYKVAKAKMEAGRGTDLAVQRFQAEVRKAQSEKLIVRQDIIEVENRINFLVGRFPQPVERNSARFYDLTFPLSVGVPAQLLVNRPDIRQAERELAANGLDVLVARAHFFPKVDITGTFGYEAFNPRYLFWTPDALIAGVAADVVQPLLNKKAIQAEYKSANARQLQSVYNYQRVILNAFTEVVNRLSMVQNYSRSIAIKKQQLDSLEAAVGSANKLFQAARAEYIEVLLAQRDLMDGRMVMIETKRQQLAAIVNAYQALGGGAYLAASRSDGVHAPPGQSLPCLPLALSPSQMDFAIWADTPRGGDSTKVDSGLPSSWLSALAQR